MAAKRVRILNLDRAQRAIYIDFEGTAAEGDAPSFLGALWVDGDDQHWVQYVIEPALWPAADAKTPAEGGACRRATWADLSELRRIAETEDRAIVAWSNHEKDELVQHLPDAADRKWFERHVVNAIPMAKHWKRKAFPNVPFTAAAKSHRGRLGRRHELHKYLSLIGYHVPKIHGPGNSAQRIRTVRNMLAKRNGDYAALTSTSKGKWTKALAHNWHDCNGLRELVIRIAGDSA